MVHLMAVETPFPKSAILDIQDASLKVMSATFLIVHFLSLNKNTCQTRKNNLYFTSKALFFHKKIKFQNFSIKKFLS